MKKALKFTAQFFGLDDVWNKTRYGEWDRYFAWTYLISLIIWIRVLLTTGIESDDEPLTIAASIFGATTGTALTAILATEFTKMVTRPAIEFFDEKIKKIRQHRMQQHEDFKEGLREEGREEEYQRIVLWAKEHGIDPPPPPVLNNGKETMRWNPLFGQDQGRVK